VSSEYSNLRNSLQVIFSLIVCTVTIGPFLPLVRALGACYVCCTQAQALSNQSSNDCSDKGKQLEYPMSR